MLSTILVDKAGEEVIEDHTPLNPYVFEQNIRGRQLSFRLGGFGLTVLSLAMGMFSAIPILGCAILCGYSVGLFVRLGCVTVSQLFLATGGAALGATITGVVVSLVDIAINRCATATLPLLMHVSLTAVYIYYFVELWELFSDNCNLVT